MEKELNIIINNKIDCIELMINSNNFNLKEHYKSRLIYINEKYPVGLEKFERITNLYKEVKSLIIYN